MIIWQPDQKINNGRFIIQGKPLGEGGFGITYKALEPSTGKLYAIKTLNQQMQLLRSDFAEQQIKFINEALTIKGFDHPHILKVHEVIQEGELFGVVMEYIDGVTLFEYVQDKGQLSETEALLYVNQIGQALELIHQKQHLHRDIKPENILLRHTTRKAILIDFGLAREFTIDQTGSMTNAKTEGYAPPEQYERRGRFDAYVDVYALAATLYNLLTGKVPLPVNFRKAGIPLPPPKQFNSQISQRVNDAILKGMELEPQERTPTVLEFRKNLGLVSSGGAEVQLKSSVGMDYRQLRDLLAVGKWKEADAETARVMLAAMKREKEGWLREEDTWFFPCEDLRTIDQLWVKYSNGRFGFSVQKRIYQSLGGKRSYDEEIWRAFGDKVGWRKGGEWLYYKDITFDITAPEAHLPCYTLTIPYTSRGEVGYTDYSPGFGLWWWWGGGLFSRVETCKM
ncbi:protein kinase domain-containing protein [Anabaena sp. FACHB-709]|uniref:Serine/threonine kinase n=2 Tax=Nostocaceae TaxID=1162 RepID=A0A1Z4KNP3_ANAVA|nr:MULTISPECIES: serine/threonine-protein kinase [Nostocaceae]BAY70554.1 serine/threonine kinase [Trichormus variabilis NIES-23]HBW29046.1 serine/threonine protein kinase [Nostoc sp. UBA8866]MBD2173264.1 GUN4 domain-containing protein [Anabaena cylindrica FACHB-318]MBD2265015.1 GUN4 domain-containing protein [Anabaena sp. FACHB-709]MBD2274325.1 GUN4 domain-containing protein [Nostoc sp. PCC 7120 = FACHB-418]